MSRLAMWHGEPTIDDRQLSRAKVVLVAIIVVTSVLPLVYVRPDDAPLRINIFKYLAKSGAFIGSMLLLWQFLLGFRGVVSSILPDLTWVVDLHKKLGQFGVPIILLHPVFIGLYYLQHRDQNIFWLDLGTTFSQLVLLGMVTLAVIAFVVLSSVLLRGRIGFYRWLYTHLSSYVIPPFLFIHSFLLGPTIQGTALRYHWWFYTGLVVALYLYRLLHKMGLPAGHYRVVDAREVADDTTQIVMAPQTRRLLPAPGQFIYLRRSASENSHPYTVSTYDRDEQLVGVTVSKAGPQTSALQDAKQGDEIILDGPFGVFTRAAMGWELPIVLIAGGIGITPFRRIWETLEDDASREAHIFYANERFADIAYRDELDALDHVNVVHVLNDEPDFEGETGLLDLAVLKRHLPVELAKYVYLMCGPPPMVSALEEELRDAGVPADQVRHELFAN